MDIVNYKKKKYITKLLYADIFGEINLLNKKFY